MRIVRLPWVRALLPVLVASALEAAVGERIRPHVWFLFYDARRLEQVVTNLVSNAVKYGEPGTGIEVDVRVHTADAEISVTNRGPQIPADELPFLFARYVRSRAARTSAVEGAGLGLFIAKGLVEAHGGHIWAESLPPGITTFHFTIPLGDADVRAARSDSSPPALSETRR